MTEEQIKKVKRMYSDPDWVLVAQMFKEYLEPLLDIRNINIENSDIARGEILAKISMYNCVNAFFTDAQALNEVIKKQQENLSME